MHRIRLFALALTLTLLTGCGASETEGDDLERKLASGRFSKVRERSNAEELTQEQRDKIEELESIGYVAGSRETSSEAMIPRFDPLRTASGLNFFCSGHGPESFLMDMEGNFLHQWSMPSEIAFPDHVQTDYTQNHQFWRRAVLQPNGDVLGIFEGIGIFRIDKDSRLLWSVANGAHHDLDFLPNGDIVVITRKAHIVERIHPTDPVLEDFLTVLSPDGETLQEVSLIDCFENSRFVIRGLYEGEHTGDLLHTNGLQVLTAANQYTVSWMQPGFLLVSMRHISALAVIDLAEERMVRVFRGQYVWQHDPRVLPDGNLLLFDNRGLKERSRVLELDLTDLSTVWEYHGSEEDQFFSDTCGMAERLPNGNTMITESDNGRAIEITPNGEIVWEFYNPNRAGESGQYIATLFEMRRLPPKFCDSWLEAGPNR